jgi:hypothetical protein
MKFYPKLTLLFASFVLAYVLFHVGAFDWMGRAFNGHGYVSVFLGGILFSFGFTAAFGVAIFTEMAPLVHPLLAALVGGFGAFLSDLLIFQLIRFSFFHDELHRLKSTRLFLRLSEQFRIRSDSTRLRRLLLWSFAGLIIASPLPDEFGVTLVSGISAMKPRDFALLCFFLNSVGIFCVLLLARAMS